MLHIIYIPGLGDQRSLGQRLAARTWGLYGVSSEVANVGWAVNEPWSVKLARLQTRVDKARTAGKQVGLIGSSAGGAAVMSLLGNNPGLPAVVICGKLLHPETLGQAYTAKNPALTEACRTSQEVIENLAPAQARKILSVYAMADELVPRRDSFIPGAHNRQTHSVGHAITIGLQITLGARHLINFLKGEAA